MKQREVIIFGAGREGERFMCQHFQDVQISCFWDNRKTGEVLGYPIETPQEGKDCFIIVASRYYLEIREQLTQMGYCEFNDFIPSQIFGKKMAIAYGNCHMSVIKVYLESHKKFASAYGFYPFPMIQIWKDTKEDFKDVLKHCDLFLHQSVRKDNVYGEQFSSENVLSCLQKTCEVIAVPNLYGMPKYLFPQLVTMKWRSSGLFRPFFMDRNMLAWVKGGKSVDEIKKLILGGGVYQKATITELWETSIKKAEMREKEWDIKILDYILLNQRKQKLFCDTNHITSRTAFEISNRILNYMGYGNALVLERAFMDDRESIIYADVAEALGLEFDKKYIRKWAFDNAVYPYEMDEEEYIEQMVQYIRFYLSRGLLE